MSTNDALPVRLADALDANEEVNFEEFENRREQLHEITQDTRFNLIQTILMHPKQLPTLDEVEFMHPDRSRATLREHLEKLRQLGIVRKVELPKEQQTRDNPKVFYGLSEEGREILGEFGLLDIEDTLQFLYRNMKKPDRILRYEKAPRPNDPPGDNGVTSEITN